MWRAYRRRFFLRTTWSVKSRYLAVRCTNRKRRVPFAISVTGALAVAAVKLKRKASSQEMDDIKLILAKSGIIRDSLVRGQVFCRRTGAIDRTRRSVLRFRFVVVPFRVEAEKPSTMVGACREEVLEADVRGNT